MTRQQTKRHIKILYVNTYGQTKLTGEKQEQIQSLIKFYKIDIAHLQESDIIATTFENCPFLKNSYSIISNNSSSGYGTASLVHNIYLCIS